MPLLNLSAIRLQLRNIFPQFNTIPVVRESREMSLEANILIKKRFW